VALSSDVVTLLHNGQDVASIREDPKTLSVILAMYQMYVGMADKISERRQTANSFFLALNSAIISIGGYTAVKETVIIPTGLIWLTAAAGVMISALWFRLILSYRDLNTAKFNVIHQLEKLLPVSPYDAEWQSVGRGEKSWLYRPFSHIELWVPFGFMVIHVLGAKVILNCRP
jgi:hypothetical protein